MFITVTLTYLTAISSWTSKKSPPDIRRKSLVYVSQAWWLNHSSLSNSNQIKRCSRAKKIEEHLFSEEASVLSWMGLVWSFRRYRLICLLSGLNEYMPKQRPSKWTSQLESDTDWWWGGRDGSSATYLVRGECGRQWPGVKVSSVPVPDWGPSACQSHILIANIILIYTNEYKWLTGLHKRRVINYYRC